MGPALTPRRRASLRVAVAEAAAAAGEDGSGRVWRGVLPGALPELVGVAGVVCLPEPGPIAAALRRMLADPAHRQARVHAGRERARGLTWAATAAGWRDALARAVEQGAPARDATAAGGVR